MSSLEEVNRLGESGVDHYQILSFDGSRLVIMGSFDLAYYHDVEVIFSEVYFINCPTYLTEPRFRDAGSAEDGGHRFEIVAEEGRFEIVAEGISVELGKVYHYDRGDQLQPGERIADWVDRGKGV